MYQWPVESMQTSEIDRIRILEGSLENVCELIHEISDDTVNFSGVA